MIYGLFSDVHSNWEAFEAVSEALKKEKIDQYIFLGDIVGYGADPKVCLKHLKILIDEEGCICVGGNHDYAVCEKTSSESYNMVAQESIEWTKSQIDAQEKDILTNMELVQRIPTDKDPDKSFTVVHASFDYPDQWRYILDIDDAQLNFKVLEDQICFIAHSHRPIVFTSGEIVDWSLDETVPIQKDIRYIINIGSVGQPRDGNPKSSFAVYNSESNVLEIKRVSYDIKKAQKKIIDAGLPQILAERLSIGK